VALITGLPENTVSRVCSDLNDLGHIGRYKKGNLTVNKLISTPEVLTNEEIAEQLSTIRKADAEKERKRLERIKKEANIAKAKELLKGLNVEDIAKILGEAL
jgi:hypothetical protein